MGSNVMLTHRAKPLRLLGLCLATLLFSAGATQQFAAPSDDAVKLTIKNGARVYFPADLSTGDKVEKQKPAVVASRRVFDATPEYQEIRRRELDSSSAECQLLQKRASDRFLAAITRCVDRGGYDLVAEAGAVSSEDATLPDVTDEVIKGL
jgi:hypothetical protein